MSRRVLLVLAALLVVGCGASPSPTPSAASATAATAVPSASASLDPSSEASASASPTASATASATASTAPTDAPSEASPSTGPAVAAFDLPETPVSAPLDQAYNSTGDPFNPAHLGRVRPGQVTARWYLAGDRWVVHYDGLDLEATGPLCPGSSAQTAAGFEHVSNAPTEAGACDGFDGTLATDPVGVRRCGDEVLYLTAIPADVKGILFASIETQYQAPGSVVGVTGMADADSGEPPEVDLAHPACDVVPARP